MAVKREPGNRFSGLAADTKPTGIPDGSIFCETDTGKQYTWDNGATTWRQDLSIRVARVGTTIGTRDRINIDGGASITDDAGSNEIDVTIFPNYATLTAASSVLPSSGSPTRATINGTNVSYDVLDFPDASTTSAFWSFSIPSGWVERDIVFKMRWRAAAVTTGNTVWDIAVFGVIENEAIDAALTAFGNTTGDAAAGTLGQMSEFTITFTAASFDLTGSDLLHVRLQRLGGHANDTMADTARFIQLTVELK